MNSYRQSNPMFLILLLLITVMFVVWVWNGTPSAKQVEISATDLYKALNDDKVREINVNASEVTGVFIDGKNFKTHVADVSALEKAALAKGVKFTVTPETNSGWSMILWLAIGVVVVFVLMFLFAGRSRGSSSSDVPNSGMHNKLASQEQGAERPTVRYSDVAGCEEAIEDLKEVVEFFDNPGRYQKFGASAPRGTLLMGPPGTGKTLLARATAGESHTFFINANGSDFMELFVGMGPKNVRELFAKAKQHGRCIIFIDELDAIAKGRGVSWDAGEHDRTVNALLAEMDGFEANDQVVVIAATNRPENLDSAILRPGRFDRKIMVGLPDVRGREAILEIHSRNKPLDNDVRLVDIAKSTPGFSGADLAAVMNEAALLAIRRNKESISQRELSDSVDRVILGPERRRIISEKEKSITAYHEGGHALIAKLLVPKTNPIRKVTIIPRGLTGGATWTMPAEDIQYKEKSCLLAELVMTMGGRAAEMLIFNEESSGARGDFNSATDVARKMICEYGMSDKLGKAILAHSSEFLNISSSRLNCSEETKRLIDVEIKRILDEAYSRALELLTKNKTQLDAIAKALLEKETLTGPEVDEILRNINTPK
ncbi:MAG: ATP-dependent zinc metalloprotease FtsH [Parcubacteria group bacterium GW2011_GWA2_47_8b]|uniref:ATP-dependent zinc metalloprotease FtsH n=2 Tax=Candidatus Harrisoniibacteriota TaxID=1817905 RepID=A0A1G1ZXU6_9BACT|nr:MAG: ATP-dependent zinc metalloprotease FtsH [Parcubacteria group bacterium GW2011_GWA2_47_8b]KKU97330.1 MAG: ATP-dependent zinc metalloprotease FtsH [Parcubacteria group bacterium GW2011_GWB1_48_6]OGY63960.1 MAG: hypothetical protein A3E64_00260 [Candidatus Harrisonbacteria bacterium RIFCSPHIGHO2_12_FULL_48_16]OGY68697.1 MAG: hypothetical protein A2214_01785 [Candidatus Harrisonbacteria bacterium RIFOXYA1_FULL_48_8]